MIRNPARRVRSLNQEIEQIDQMLTELVGQVAPSLLELHGIGPDNAASLLVTAGDKPQRIRSEGAWANLCGVAPISASSGKVVRYRLNRGGDRHANAALYRMVLTRMSNHPETRRYVARRRAEGRSTGEIIRCLKRYGARQIFKHLPAVT
ncbi:MAG: transposase [Acidimicrobiia bacterium]